MRSFTMRMSEVDMDLLDKKRGTLGRSQYLTELMRRGNLRTVMFNDFTAPVDKESPVLTKGGLVVAKNMTLKDAGKIPLRKGATSSRRPKSLEEEMLGL